MSMFSRASALPEISVTEAHERLSDGVTLLDVREPHEFDAVHVPGAVNVPLSQFAAAAGELDGDRPISVICRSGNRSAMAVQHLRRLGFDAANVAGGMMSWQQAGLLTGTQQQARSA